METYFKFAEEYQRTMRMIAFFWEKAPKMMRISSDFPRLEAERTNFMRGFETFAYVVE